ncbi:MAG: 50S ribosomal protein L25 [Chloroflexota bacterium]|nr:50S ribosomal protein L25 [Chloroflexota bacterium]
MDEFTIEIQKRTEVGSKARLLRVQGVVPGVLYGGEADPENVQVDGKTFDRMLARGGAAHVVELVGDGIPQTQVLIREVQRHPVRRNVLHVDFVRIARDVRIRMAVPVVLFGEAPATAEGAILLQGMDAVEIECLPADLPSQFEIDVSGLEHISDRVTLDDLILPEGVVLYGEVGDKTIVSLTIPRSVLHDEDEEAEILDEEMLDGEVEAEEAEAESEQD